MFTMIISSSLALCPTAAPDHFVFSAVADLFAACQCSLHVVGLFSDYKLGQNRLFFIKLKNKV